MEADNVVLIVAAIAAGIGVSFGGLLGLLIAHLHYRARLQERINQAAPSLWRT